MVGEGAGIWAQGFSELKACGIQSLWKATRSHPKVWVSKWRKAPANEDQMIYTSIIVFSPTDSSVFPRVMLTPASGLFSTTSDVRLVSSLLRSILYLLKSYCQACQYEDNSSINISTGSDFSTSPSLMVILTSLSTGCYTLLFLIDLFR